MNKINLTTIGSDPEFLLKDINTGNYISSLNYIPGDKESPVELNYLGKGFSIQKDNVLAEFCVPPVSIKNASSLWANIKLAMSYAENEYLPTNIKLDPNTIGEYEQSELCSELAITFGCSQSYNAWNLSVDSAEPNTSNFRYAGFHVHLGFDNNDTENIINLVRALDLFVGVPSVLFDETAKTRREQYGKAGEFRPTSYGLEYRVLGAYVMKSKDYFDALIEGILMAVDFVNEGKSFTDEEQVDIQLAINTCNVGLATNITNKYNMESRIINKVFVLE